MESVERKSKDLLNVPQDLQSVDFNRREVYIELNISTWAYTWKPFIGGIYF